MTNRMDLGERPHGRGCSFFSIEVPSMPLTLCHSSLRHVVIPQCELERTQEGHPSPETQRLVGNSLLVVVVVVVAR